MILLGSNYNKSVFSSAKHHVDEDLLNIMKERIKIHNKATFSTSTNRRKRSTLDYIILAKYNLHGVEVCGYIVRFGEIFTNNRAFSVITLYLKETEEVLGYFVFRHARTHNEIHVFSEHGGEAHFLMCMNDNNGTKTPSILTDNRKLTSMIGVMGYHHFVNPKTNDRTPFNSFMRDMCSKEEQILNELSKMYWFQSTTKQAVLHGIAVDCMTLPVINNVLYGMERYIDELKIKYTTTDVADIAAAGETWLYKLTVSFIHTNLLNDLCSYITKGMNLKIINRRN